MNPIEQSHMPDGHALRWVITEKRTRPATQPKWDGREVVGVIPDPEAPPVEVTHLIAFGSTAAGAMLMARMRQK